MILFGEPLMSKVENESHLFYIYLKLVTLGYRIMVNVGPEKPLVKHTAVTVEQKTVRVV